MGGETVSIHVGVTYTHVPASGKQGDRGLDIRDSSGMGAMHGFWVLLCAFLDCPKFLQGAAVCGVWMDATGSPLPSDLGGTLVT